MPECKWCISFDAKTVWPKPGHPDTQFRCNNPKGLFDAGPTDSCDHLELDEAAAQEHDERAADEYKQNDELSHGLG